MSTATVGDPGKLMRAQHAGECAECGGSILPGQTIYYSTRTGAKVSRHKRCVDRGETAGAPAAETRVARGVDSRDLGVARDGIALWPDDDAPRAAPPAPRDEYVAPARATAFGQAGDRDAARRELAGVLDLLIEADEKRTEAYRRIRKLLS